MAAVADRTGRHVAAPSFHHAVPGGGEPCLQTCRCGHQHAPQGGRPYAKSRSGPAQAAYRAQRHHPGGMARHCPALAQRHCQPHCDAKSRWPHGSGLCRLARHTQRAGRDVAGGRTAAQRTVQLRAGGRWPREGRAAAPGAGIGAGAGGVLRPHPQGADSLLPGRGGHCLHRLAARTDLPLRHRAEQADGLHDGALRGAALGRGR